MSFVERALGRKGAADRIGQPGGLAEATQAPAATPSAKPATPARGAPVFASRNDVPAIPLPEDWLRARGLLGPEEGTRLQADQFRMVKRKLLSRAFATQNVRVTEGPGVLEYGNLIMVASAMPEDGKTFASVNLALSMTTEADLTVILVDADVPKSHLTKEFQQMDRAGLLDYLADEKLVAADIAVPTSIPRLFFVPVGSSAEHAADLLANRRIMNLAKELPQRCVVIFDSPPLLVASDAQVLAKTVGQVLMVVRAGKTPQNAVLNALSRLESTKAVAMLLNQWEPVHMFEKQGYGTYYNYGEYRRSAQEKKKNT